MKAVADDTFVIDDTNDVLPALAWASGLSIVQVQDKIDEMNARGLTSEQMFEHFSVLAALRGHTLCKFQEEGKNLS